jgi:hypothetical protein
MNWYSLCVAAALAAPVCFGADAPKIQAQAQLLDHAEFLCSNCLFGPSDYYYCMEADNKILIGYQRTPVMNWHDQSKNFLETVRPSWTPWAAGENVAIRYDEKNIWIDRPDFKKPPEGFWREVKGAAIWATHGEGKKVKLKRSTIGDIFMKDIRCRSVAPPVKAH